MSIPPPRRSRAGEKISIGGSFLAAYSLLSLAMLTCGEDSSDVKGLIKDLVIRKREEQSGDGYTSMNPSSASGEGGGNRASPGAAFFRFTLGSCRFARTASFLQTGGDVLHAAFSTAARPGARARIVPNGEPGPRDGDEGTEMGAEGELGNPPNL